jgi:threonine/homoserine/homoserine lactone efflux protein
MPAVPSLETTGAFVAVALVLAYAPGPDNVFVLMQSMARGARAGMLVVLGLCTGLCLHTAAVALGLAAVFAASALAFTILKVVGAAYLAYLAWQAYRAPARSLAEGRAETIAPRALYLRGVVMNLTNPKVLLFFLALLPQFVDPARGPVAPQIVWFGGCFIAATVVAFGSIALLAGAVGARLQRSERGQRLLHRASALVFAGLAVRLLTAVR